MKLNVYEMDEENCPICDAKELTYVLNCRACHCGNCGKWIDLDGKLLEDE